MSRIAGMLEKMHRELNKESFGGVLETPIITVQNKRGTYGHITCNRVWKNHANGTEQFEINIASQFLTRNIENVVATLIHEMTHQYNLQMGVQDTSRGNAYHNKKFRDEAEKHMIKISHDDTIGWSITEPTEELLDYIIEKGWTEILVSDGNIKDLFGGFGGFGKAPKTPTTPTVGKTGNSHSRKYQCPKCKCSVRATKEVRIMCADCMELMIEV